MMYETVANCYFKILSHLTSQPAYSPHDDLIRAMPVIVQVETPQAKETSRCMQSTGGFKHKSNTLCIHFMAPFI